MAEDQNNIVDEVGGEGAPMPAPEPTVQAEVGADLAPEPELETGPEVAPDRIEYMLPGFPQPISLPGNLSNEQRAKAISAYLQSDDAKRFIDRDTGAPPFVRCSTQTCHRAPVGLVTERPPSPVRCRSLS